jgi:hypothetical protein
LTLGSGEYHQQLQASQRELAQIDTPIDSLTRSVELLNRDINFEKERAGCDFSGSATTAKFPSKWLFFQILPTPEPTRQRPLAALS